MRILPSLILTLALAACAASETPGPAAGAPSGQMMTQGRSIAEGVCAQCHAVRLTGQSPNQLAPPFRTLGARYDESTLSRKLADIETGHYQMPPLKMTGDEIMSLMEYIREVSPATTGPDGTR